MVNYKNIQHKFYYTCVDLVGLFENVSTFYEFKKRLEKQADSINIMKKDEYLGDGFEFFVELLLRLNPYDKRLNINGEKYEIVTPDLDNGCDGYSENLDGQMCAIQIKFRSDQSHILKRLEDNLSSMIEEALHQGIVYANDGEMSRHFIITNAAGMDNKTQMVKYRNKVKCINIHTIKKVVDNQKAFWEKCLEISREFVKKEMYTHGV